MSGPAQARLPQKPANRTKRSARLTRDRAQAGRDDDAPAASIGDHWHLMLMSAGTKIAIKIAPPQQTTSGRKMANTTRPVWDSRARARPIHARTSPELPA